jgi:hypothetical protein
MNMMNCYNDRGKRWTLYKILLTFWLFDQPSDKSTVIQKRYNDSMNRYTFYEALNTWQSVT